MREGWEAAWVVDGTECQGTPRRGWVARQRRKDGVVEEETESDADADDDEDDQDVEGGRC